VIICRHEQETLAHRFARRAVAPGRSVSFPPQSSGPTVYDSCHCWRSDGPWERACPALGSRPPRSGATLRGGERGSDAGQKPRRPHAASAARHGGAGLGRARDGHTHLGPSGGEAAAEVCPGIVAAAAERVGRRGLRGRAASPGQTGRWRSGADRAETLRVSGLRRVAKTREGRTDLCVGGVLSPMGQAVYCFIFPMPVLPVPAPNMEMSVGRNPRRGVQTHSWGGRRLDNSDG
jgi:hypothetical protein